MEKVFPPEWLMWAMAPAADQLQKDMRGIPPSEKHVWMCRKQAEWGLITFLYPRPWVNRPAVSRWCMLQCSVISKVLIKRSFSIKLIYCNVNISVVGNGGIDWTCVESDGAETPEELLLRLFLSLSFFMCAPSRLLSTPTFGHYSVVHKAGGAVEWSFLRCSHSYFCC